MTNLLEAFQSLFPKSRASLKASSWELSNEELDTTSTDPIIGGPAGSPIKKVTIVGNGEEGADGVVQLGETGIDLGSSALTTGDKSDTFVGIGSSDGVRLRGLSSLNTGKGNDTINGDGVRWGLRLVASNLDMGDGNDTINGVSLGRAVDVLFSSELSMGEGNDSIHGKGDKGVITGANSIISMGEGNDTIKGEGGEFGVFVGGGVSKIDMGSGDDNIDAIIGGFKGAGLIDLGVGNDTLIGSGFASTILFNGGDGEDKIVLDDGTYMYFDNGTDSYLTDSSGEVMNIINFELISGINGTIDQYGVVNGMGTGALVEGNTFNIVDGFLELIV